MKFISAVILGIVLLFWNLQLSNAEPSGDAVVSDIVVDSMSIKYRLHLQVFKDNCLGNFETGAHELFCDGEQEDLQVLKSFLKKEEKKRAKYLASKRHRFQVPRIVVEKAASVEPVERHAPLPNFSSSGIDPSMYLQVPSRKRRRN